MDKQIKSPETKKNGLALGISIALRIVAVGFSLGSACLMVTDNQTAVVFGFAMGAKYSYAPAFKFMAFANVAVGGFAVISLIVSLLLYKKGMTPNYYFLFFLHDLAVTVLEMAACAAATTQGQIGKYGNEHSGWMAICGYFGWFCERAKVSILLSYLAFACFLCLTITSASLSRGKLASTRALTESDLSI